MKNDNDLPKKKKAKLKKRDKKRKKGMKVEGKSVFELKKKLKRNFRTGDRPR